MSRENSFYIIGDSRTNADNAITMRFGAFFIAMEIDPDNEEILKFNCAHTVPLTEEFLRSIFVGKRILADGEAIEREIMTRYFGASRRAILVSYRDAAKRFEQARQ